MSKLFRKLHKKQSGFTAIEMLIGIAILGIIGVAIALSITQTFRGTTLSNDRMTAINNVRNAGDWITLDTRMATEVTITDNCPTITWSDFESPDSQHIVAYSLSGTDLRRSHQVDDGTISVITVAQNLDPTNPITSEFINGELTVTVTSTVGSTSEIRTFVIIPRNMIAQ